MESFCRLILIKQMKIYLRYIILLILFAVTTIHGQISDYTLPDIEEYILNNNMRVLISPNYESPTINISMYINAGKMDSPYDKPTLGETVFFELDEGTKKYPKKDQLKEKLFSLGAARGSFKKMWFNDDHAIINHDCLKEDARDCIEIFAEIVRYPTLPFHNKLTQKLTVMMAPKKTFGSLWESPWKHAKFMYSGLINRFSPKYQLANSKKEAMNWYNKYIRPENITLMISGDINYIYIKKLVNEYFGDWESSIPISTQNEYNINVTDSSGINVQFTAFKDAEEARIVILKKTTKLNSFWDPAIQMALSVFVRERIDIARQNIDHAGWISWGWQQSNRMPYMYIQAKMDYVYLDRYYAELISEFNNISNNSITEEELKSAQITKINDYKNKTYTPEQLNNHVQYYYNYNGYSLEKFPKMIDDINAVTIEEINAAAKKVFDPNNFVMAIAGNKDSCATILGQFPNIEYYERAEEIRASASSP